MASLGKSTVRALLKGANDGAGRTKIADLNKPEGVLEGHMRKLRDGDVYWPENDLGGMHKGPLTASERSQINTNPRQGFNKGQKPMNEMDYSRGLSEFTASRDWWDALPWKADVVDPTARRVAGEVLEDLVVNNDKKALENFAQKFFAQPWKAVKRSVLETLGL